MIVYNLYWSTAYLVGSGYFWYLCFGWFVCFSVGLLGVSIGVLCCLLLVIWFAAWL